MKGKDWYYVVNQELTVLAIQYGLSIECVTGIFVSLSAQVPYEENMRLCKMFLSTGNLSGMMVCRAKINACKRIKSGEEPLSVWYRTSFKYHNFYKSLLLQDNAVCIDTHMINMYLEQHPYSKLFDYTLAQIFKSAKLLEPIRKWILRQANQYQLKTFEMQSVLWVEYRGQMF